MVMRALKEKQMVEGLNKTAKDHRGARSLLLFVYGPALRAAPALLLFVLLSTTMASAVLLDWQVNGDSYISGQRVYLTPDADDQAGSALYKGQINLDVDYVFNLRVNLGSNNSSGADGIALLFHNDPGGGIFATGLTSGGGEWIGTNGIFPAVVVEIDTYQNSSRGDPTCDHLGINIYPSNGSGTPDHSGAGPTCAKASSPINIEDGNEYDFDVTWNATTNTLAVYFNGVLRLSYTNDIVSNVFGGNSRIYLGWTGSTGGSSNLQYIVVDNVGPASEIEIGKTVDNATPTEGEPIIYTVTATNNGTDDASGITVSDALPAGLTYTGSTPSQGTYNSGTGVWDVGSLAAGSTATLAITATPNAGTQGSTITNTASLDTLDQFDSDFSNNTASVDVTVSSTSVSIAKTASPSSVGAGATVTYTVTLTNSGPGNAVVQEFEDTLPAGFTYVPGSASGTVTTDPAISGQTLTWSGTWIAHKNAGPFDGTTSFTFEATAGSASGTYTNMITATGPAMGAVSTGATAPVTVVLPEMDLTKAVDNSTPSPGDEITYSIVFQNVGGAAAQNVSIVDSIPADTTYAPESMRLGAAGSSYAGAAVLTDAADADEGQVSGNQVIFTISSVSPDDSVAGSGSDEGILFFKVTID